MSDASLMPESALDDLEDDGADPLHNPTRDLNKSVRKLAAAVLVRAVLDSKLRSNLYAREDATKFLYPDSECARAHLRLLAELAGLSPAWLNECLVRIRNSPRLQFRNCINCKTPTPPDGFAPGSRLLCLLCREAIPVRPKCSHPGTSGRRRKVRAA